MNWRTNQNIHFRQVLHIWCGYFIKFHFMYLLSSIENFSIQDFSEKDQWFIMSLVGDLLSDLGAENGADHNQSSSNHPILNSSLQVEAESDLEDLELSLRALEKLDRSSPDLWPEQIPGVNQFIPATPTTNQSSPSQVQTKHFTSIQIISISIFLYLSPDIFFFIYPFTFYSIRVLSLHLFPYSL